MFPKVASVRPSELLGAKGIMVEKDLAKHMCVIEKGPLYPLARMGNVLCWPARTTGSVDFLYKVFRLEHPTHLTYPKIAPQLQ